jgi:hypothetical protein
MPNQALEQTRDNVLRYGEVVGCELLNFFVRLQDARAEKPLAVLTCRQSRGWQLPVIREPCVSR